jgi:aromatic ring hydroxylase
MNNPIQAEQYIEELEKSEEVLLNDGKVVELSEEVKELIVNTYHQLDTEYKEEFWTQLTTSEESFGNLYEFCRQYNS